MGEGGDLLRFELPIGACNMRRQRSVRPPPPSNNPEIFSSNPGGYRSPSPWSSPSTRSSSLAPTEPSMSAASSSSRSRPSIPRSMSGSVPPLPQLPPSPAFSQLTTETLEQDFPLPQCTYEIREGVDGPSLKFAHVGQKVTHSWRCDPGNLNLS